MSRPSPVWTCRHETRGTGQLIGRTASPEAFVAAPILVKRQDTRSGATQQDATSRQRTKIWEFNTNLHCSIIGTCLSTGELRQVLGKLGLAPANATDHDLHHTAVSLACRHDQAAKLLNKALDHRHRLPINQFLRMRSEAEVQALWREAVGRGDIPGAYWAALTHPATGHGLIREAFGEVHMLSHLVGAANRADIQRLRDLEQQQTALEATLARQQLAFQRTVLERDARIRDLEQAVLERIRTGVAVDARKDDENAGSLAQWVVTLEKRLSTETDRCAAAEARLTRMQNVLAEERTARRAAEDAKSLLAAELEALESNTIDAKGPAPAGVRRLDGETLLYVGGRAGQVAHLRQAAEHLGATFLHHDGGREQNPDLLAGLVSRADLVLFPVDCVSHEAVLTIKRLCRLAQKDYMPLRAASLASLLLALHRIARPTRVPEAAA